MSHLNSLPYDERLRVSNQYGMPFTLVADCYEGMTHGISGSVSVAAVNNSINHFRDLRWILGDRSLEDAAERHPTIGHIDVLRVLGRVATEAVDSSDDLLAILEKYEDAITDFHEDQPYDPIALQGALEFMKNYSRILGQNSRRGCF